MRKLSRECLSARAILMASAGLWLAGPVQAQAQTAAASDGPGSEEVLVTAQKREETLKQIPLSISVVGSDALERRQATSFQDLLALVPGLALESSKPGMGRIILRGINTESPNATVGVYIDETPFGSSSGLVDSGVLSGDFDTFDVARVEVLRGPQGTLYGANSFGGVLKYVTNEPKFSGIEGKVQVGVQTVDGGDLGYSGTGVINLPVSDTIAIRASGFYRKLGGYVDSIGTAGSEIRNNINDSQSYGGRVSALFRPAEGFSLRLSAVVQNLASNASNLIEVNPETLAPLYGRFSHSEFLPTYAHVSYRIYNGTVNWDLGFADLISSTSYATFDLKLKNNLTLEYEPLITEAFGNPVTRPLDVFMLQRDKQRKFTQEVRLSSPTGSQLEWLIGAYYTHETGSVFQNYVPYDILAKKPATDIPTLSDATLTSVYKEYAGFANATWHVTDRFHLSFGGRYSRNEQSANQSFGGVLTGDMVFPEAKSAENVFTYSLAPRLDIDKNTSIYARAAKGYRPGGPNVVPPLTSKDVPRTYHSDSLFNYEVGIKTDLLSKTISIDAAAFYLKWKNIQLFTVVDGTGVNANGKTAVSQGFEFNTTLRPTRGLSVSFNGAYTDARLRDDTPEIAGGLKGDRLPYTAPWTISVNGNYEWALRGTAKAYVGGGFRFLSKQPADFDQAYRDAHGYLRTLPSYEVIDLNAGIDFGRWSIEAFVKNLNNARGYTTVTTVDAQPTIPNGAAMAGLLRPRVIGMTLVTSF